MLPTLGYLALSLIIMAPVLPVFTTAIPGGPIAEVDGWQNVWNLWWVHRALATPTNPFFTPLLFYPQGVDLTLQTLNISNGILFLPVTALFGPIAAYNAAVLTALVLSGVGGYALALRVSGDRLAAFIGGAIFAFSPFHLTKIWDGQLEMITLQWAAFYAFFLLRAVEDLRRRDALIAGVFLALTGYTSWYYLFFFGVYTLLFAAIWLAGAARERRVPMLRQFMFTAASGVTLLLPLLIAAGRTALTTTGVIGMRFDPSNPLDLILIHSANLYDLFLPNGLHPLWGSAVETLVRTWHPYIGAWNIALGYTALALATAALALARSNAWRWAVIGLAAIVLSLGPLVHIGATRTAIPLPYQILLALPGLELARRPSHFVVIATLMLAPLAALGLQALRQRATHRHGYLLAGVTLAAIAFEYAPPHWSLFPFRIHPYYAQISAVPGAVIEIPPLLEASLPLKAQIVHGQPLVGGFVSRPPRYRFVEQAPGVRQLWTMRPDDTHLFVDRADNRLKEFNAYGVRHIIIHWAWVAPERRAELQAALRQALGDLAPVYADEELSAYRVPTMDSGTVAYASFGDGWHTEERDGDRRWRWMGPEGEIVLVNAGEHDAPVRLSLDVRSYAEARQVMLLFDQHLLGDRLVEPAGVRLSIHLLLPPGEHRVLLRANAMPDPALPARLISIVVSDAHLQTIQRRIDALAQKM
ncbi:hypothetical protein [Roseiflexus castenholzii]|nr:hypothetical protein [Roseiflexus castenholzii]